MKITNNRSRGAWFNYRVKGMPKRIFLKAYETSEVSDFTDIDQSNHHKTISDFSDSKPIFDSGQTTNVITTRDIDNVDEVREPVGPSQQIARNFSVKFTSQL